MPGVGVAVTPAGNVSDGVTPGSGDGVGPDGSSKRSTYGPMFQAEVRACPPIVANGPRPPNPAVWNLASIHGAAGSLTFTATRASDCGNST